MTRYLFVLIAGLFFLGISTAEAEMYKWVDENGVVHFSDSPVQNASKEKDMETVESVGSSGSQPSLSNEWMDRDAIFNQAGLAAEAFLLEHENWPEKPLFSQFHTVEAGQFISNLILQVKLPAVMLEGKDCYMAYQRVRVKTEIDPNDRTKARITGVELAGRVLQPPDCLN